jgi:hypothetical protein
MDDQTGMMKATWVKTDDTKNKTKTDTTTPDIQTLGGNKTQSYSSLASAHNPDNKNTSLQGASHDVRQTYFNQLQSDYNKYYQNNIGFMSNFSVPHTFQVNTTADGKEFVNFEYGVGNFFDKANRDNSNIPVKYDNGKPYVTIEGEFGNNDEHTIWLDDTWNNLGFNSIGEYIAYAMNYKGDSSELKARGHIHKGD